MNYMLEILELEKPLIFFDLETTGLNKHSDKIVEFSALKLYPELSEISITFSINPRNTYTSRSNQNTHDWRRRC